MEMAKVADIPNSPLLKKIELTCKWNMYTYSIYIH